MSHALIPLVLEEAKSKGRHTEFSKKSSFWCYKINDMLIDLLNPRATWLCFYFKLPIFKGKAPWTKGVKL